MTVKLSIVVCTYNRSDLLPFCLDSLIAQDLCNDLYEIILIDNNSTDDTKKIAEQYAQQSSLIRYFFESEEGVSHARNRGYKEGKGKYIAYIDDDAKASVSWARSILDTFETVEPKPVAVGGKILPWLEKNKTYTQVKGYRRIIQEESITWGNISHFLKIDSEIPFFGSNMAFKKRVLIEVGGFSLELGMKKDKIWFGEEPDLFLRLCGAGYENHFWYNKDLVVYHYTPFYKFTFFWRAKRQFRSAQSQFIIFLPRAATKEALKYYLVSQKDNAVKIYFVIRGSDCITVNEKIIEIMILMISLCGSCLGLMQWIWKKRRRSFS